MSEAEEITILALPRSAAMAVAVALVVAGCGGSPTSPTSTSDPSTAGAGNRQFSGMVELPASTLMDVSLRIQNRTVDASPLRLTFVALLIAQENGTVRGSYTLHTVPPREGQIDGTFGGASFLTAGIFDGTFTETTPSGCLAQRNYSGAVTAAGINLLGGRMLQQCPETPFDGLAAVAISVADGTGAPDPDPDPDPDPAPDPDPDPDPGQRFTLTVTRDGSGLGTVTSQPGGINCGNDCSEPYDQGTVVTLIPTPDQGATFIRWGGDADCEDGRVTMNGQRRCTATFNVVPENTLAVTLSGAGTGTVTSNPPGISCGFDCSEPYSPGTVVRLTATADSGSTFVGWSGDPDCSDAQVTMDGVVACTATFDQIFRTLTVTVNGTGSGTVTASPPGISCPGSGCTKDYAQGTAVALIATPAGGSTFAGWSGAADCADGNVTMNGARACTATFDLIPPNTLAVTVTGTGSGTVTSNPAGIDNCPGTDCSEAYSPGTMVTLSATPGANSIFGGWTGDADCSDGMVTLSAAIGCTATFDAVRTLTTVISGGTGTVTSNPGAISCPGVCTDGTYLNGTDVTLTALATGNSTFAGWSGTGCGASVSMTADRTCTANFIPPRTLDITIAGGGTGTVTSSPGTISCPGTCTDAFTNGTVVALTPTPTGGSTFAGWSGTGCSNSVTMSIDRACTATFDPPASQQTLDITIAGGGTGTVTSSPGTISCPGTCTNAFTNGTVVALTPTPTGGSTFAGWSGTGCSNSVTMSIDRACTATFDPPASQQTLDITIAGGGTGTVTSSPGTISCPGTCTDAFTNGTVVALTPTPTGGSTFAGWSGTGCSNSVTMSIDRACTATFDPPAGQQTLDITIAGGGTGTVTSSPGTINCPGTCTDAFTNGTVVALTPTPTGGSTFAGWSGTGCSNSVTMSIDRACTATFDPPAPVNHTLTVIVAGTGTGDVSSDQGGIACSEAGGDCTEAYLEGTAVVLTATPSGLSTFAGWTGNCDAGGNVVPNMDAPKTCTATFNPPAPVNHTLTVIVAGTGTGDVSSDQGGIACSEAGGDCTEAYLEGTAVVLTATPSGLSTFAGWTGNCDAGGNVVPNMDAPKTCTATFDP